MSNGPTICEDCDLVDPQTRKKHGALWLCLASPRLEGMGFVKREEWVNNEPYLRCKDVNGGACRNFKPLRTAEPDGEIDDEIPEFGATK